MGNAAEGAGGKDINKDDEGIDLEIDDEGDAGEGEGKDGKGKDGGKVADQDPAARRATLARMLDRHDRKHGLGKYADGSGDGEGDRQPAKKGLDYGQKAYLATNGIKEADEVALVERTAKETGRTIEEILGNGFFQAELKTLREGRAADGAIPPNGKRAGAPAADSVEHWLAKGELPPNTPENQDLRRKVVNARLKNEGEGSKFSPNPVVGSGARR